MVRLRREIEGVRPNRSIPLPSYSLDAQASSRVLPAFDRWLRSAEPGRVLLAGGVRADIAIDLASAGHWVTLSDLDEASLGRLHARLTPAQAGRLTLVDRAYGDAAFAPSSFDLIVLFDAMHTYFEPAWLVNKAARELKADALFAARLLVRGDLEPLRGLAPALPVLDRARQTGEQAAQLVLPQLQTLLRSALAPALASERATEALERGAHLCADRFATDLDVVTRWFGTTLTPERAFAGHTLRLELADALFGLRGPAHRAISALLDRLPEMATQTDATQLAPRVVAVVARKRLSPRPGPSVH